MTVDIPPYQPNGPYILESGEYAGLSIERVMWLDPRHVRQFLMRMGGEYADDPKTSPIHRHARWLVEQGQTRVSKVPCPQCRNKPVCMFPVCRSSWVRRRALALEYTCCGSTRCRQDVRVRIGRRRQLKFLPFCFSSFEDRLLDNHQKALEDLFRKVLEQPSRLDILLLDSATDEELFVFFCETPSLETPPNQATKQPSDQTVAKLAIHRVLTATSELEQLSLFGPGP